MHQDRLGDVYTAPLTSAMPPSNVGLLNHTLFSSIPAPMHQSHRCVSPTPPPVKTCRAALVSDVPHRGGLHIDMVAPYCKRGAHRMNPHIHTNTTHPAAHAQSL